MRLYGEVEDILIKYAILHKLFDLSVRWDINDANE